MPSSRACCQGSIIRRRVRLGFDRDSCGVSLTTHDRAPSNYKRTYLLLAIRDALDNLGKVCRSIQACGALLKDGRIRHGER